MKTLLRIQEFAAQEFLQNCYCLELLKVCEILSIFYLVMCYLVMCYLDILLILLSFTYSKEHHRSKANKRQSNPFELLAVNKLF